VAANCLTAVSREDERELTREVADDAESEGTGTPERAAVESAATSFLEVERELDGMVEGMQVRGQAVDVDRIPASEVPDGFPYEITTEDALAMTFELEDGARTATTYFGWPGEETDERLGRLLQLREVPIDRFADFHGDEILLEVEAGHFVPVLPDEERRGDARAYYGVVAGFATLLFPFIAWMFGGGVGGAAFLALFVLVHLVVLPVSIYLDAWHLRTTTNWDGGPLFWAFFAMIPGLNVMTTAAYLVLRQNAEEII